MGNRKLLLVILYHISGLIGGVLLYNFYLVHEEAVADPTWVLSTMYSNMIWYACFGAVDNVVHMGSVINGNKTWRVLICVINM